MDLNKSNHNSILYILLGVVLVTAIVFWGGKLNPFSTKKSTTTISTTATDLKIKTSIYEEIINPNDTNQTVTPSEDGFGRANPFAPYK